MMYAFIPGAISCFFHCQSQRVTMSGIRCTHRGYLKTIMAKLDDDGHLLLVLSQDVQTCEDVVRLVSQLERVFRQRE